MINHETRFGVVFRRTERIYMGIAKQKRSHICLVPLIKTGTNHDAQRQMDQHFSLATHRCPPDCLCYSTKVINNHAKWTNLWSEQDCSGLKCN